MQANTDAVYIDPGSNEGDRVAEMQAQAGLYALIARCLEAEVDSGLLDLIRGSLRPKLEEMGLDLGRDVMDGDAAEVIALLAEEFAGLFVTPGAVLPFRSVFETGRLFQPQADLATQAYRDAGSEFRNVLSGEFSDHAAVLPAFVGQLLERPARAPATGDPAAAGGRRSTAWATPQGVTRSE